MPGTRMCVYISFHFCSDVCNPPYGTPIRLLEKHQEIPCFNKQCCHANCITLGVFFFSLQHVHKNYTLHRLHSSSLLKQCFHTHLPPSRMASQTRTFALDSCERFHFTHRTWCIFVVGNEFCCTHCCTTKGASVSYGSCLRV